MDAIFFFWDWLSERHRDMFIEFCTPAFKEWHDSGILSAWQNGLLACEHHLDSIDWSRVVDGRLYDQIAAVRNKTGRNPPRTKETRCKAQPADGRRIPLSLVVAAANTHDIKLVADTLDALQAGASGETQALSGQRLAKLDG